MENKPYMHAYVHVKGYDLFLNPFGDYEESYRMYNSTEQFISVVPNIGELYDPVFDRFVDPVEFIQQSWHSHV